MRKTQRERREEEARQERKYQWIQEQYKQGRKYVSRPDYDEISDMISLLALAVRRAKPFNKANHREEVYDLYKRLVAERDKMVTDADFDRQDGQPGNVIYLSEAQVKAR